MSVILRAPIPRQILITDIQKQEITDYINKYRSNHQAPNVVWNNTIAQFTQNWSNYLISNNLFQHSGTQLYGENLVYLQGYGSDLMTILKLTIDLWYNEIKSYNFAKPGFSETTGHFTCLVWKSSTEFALGFSIVNDKVIVSMNTSPPGNVIGQFETNVLMPLISPQVPPQVQVPTQILNISLPDPLIIELISALFKVTQELNKIYPKKMTLIKYIKNITQMMVSKLPQYNVYLDNINTELYKSNADKNLIINYTNQLINKLAQTIT
jgi:hypothetical protein